MAAPAVAQNPTVDLRTQLSAREVEVGEIFQLELHASSTGDVRANRPEYTPPPGIRAEGPHLSTGRSVSITGAGIQQVHSITATWNLQATKLGSYSLGAPTLQVDGRRVQGQSLTINVVAASPGGPRRRQRGIPIDPFDFFGRNSPFPFDFGDLDNDPLSDPLGTEPTFPEEYRFDQAPDSTAFLRATVDRNRIVVGQQVTLNVYAYGARGSFQEVNSTEPGTSEFLSYGIVENTYGQPAFRIPVETGADEQTVWIAVKARQIALFPLRAGKLSITPMTFGFLGRRYSRDRSEGLRRQSAPIVIEVVEPPLAGRPPGYKVGDVGQYELTARVGPREVSAGESIAVTLRLEGEGHLPPRVRIPTAHGVEWLEPTTTEEIKPKDGILQGWRSFSYIVRLTKAGVTELGAATLPFWNPKTGRYEVARAELGQVRVKEAPKGAVAQGASAAGNAEAEPESPLTLPPRRALGSPVVKPLDLGARKWFWWLLGMGPLSVLMLDGVVKTGRRVSRRLSERSASAASQARKALANARDATARGDAAGVASAIERALFLTIEASTGLKARAVLKSELRHVLERAGIESSIAKEVERLLECCDTLRFDPQAVDAAALVSEAETANSTLAKLKPKVSHEVAS